VIGAGGIGAFVVAAAASLGAGPLIAVDVSDERLATAAALGATTTVNAARQDSVKTVLEQTGGEGAHLVIESSGAPSSPGAAVQAVRRGGDIVVVGLQARPAEVDLFSVATREISVHGTLAHICGEDLGDALDLLASRPLAGLVLGGVIPLANLVTHGLRPLAERSARGKIVVAIGDPA
jgi:threonine dehydrogenase-like Zn-dependent dehydrogenase